MKHLLSLTVSDLIDKYRRKFVSPVEVMEAVLAQTALVEPAVNAFVVRENVDTLRRLAVQSEARWSTGTPAGPLDGVPIAVKDAILARGWGNRVGSLTTSPAKIDEDAPAVARMKEAGAILLGKTTTPEFGWKGVTDSRLTGITRSPWDTRLTPGGSSGGAAAAVAAGMAQAAIGTDAGGSVRIPASFCGLVAIKATRGRIPAYPPSAVWTLGHIGPITRSVADAALLLTLASRTDLRDWNALPEEHIDYLATLAAPRGPGLRVAYSPTLGYARVDAEVAAAVERVASRLVELGGVVTEVEAPLPDSREAFRTYFETALAHSVRNYDEDAMQLLDPGLAKLVERAQSITRTQFLEAYDFQIRITRAARLFHRDYDILLTPTVAVPPFGVGSLSPPGYDGDNWLDWSPFTYPFNLTGQPAVSIPCGFTAAGLPIGAQLVGPLYSDAALLRIAYALERSGLAEKRLPPCLSTGLNKL
jgi:aspartyl-tRNA(Asn)/glutamyl-tRNA(Gln) amidotransferase subunit A